MRKRATIFAVVALLFAAPANADPHRQTITISGSAVHFFALHLLLDANGHAYLDDGVLHVSAAHITLDLKAKRYLAIGDVVVTSALKGGAATEAATTARGDIFGEDFDARRGLLVSLEEPPVRHIVEGGTIDGEPAANAPQAEPLSVPDFGGETPFATATRAVAHVGADVRLTDARVALPGARSLPLPSYVYTYSPDPGYAVSNLSFASEDVPLYFGSTRDSVQGIHFIYRTDIHFALGLDQRIVDSPRGYTLASLSPIWGNQKTFNLTWQDRINDHTQQSLTSTSIEGLGTINSYDVRDGLHRSFLELNGSQFHQSYGALLAWQSYDQAMAHAGMFSNLLFHLRSEVGTTHTPVTPGYSPFPPDIFLPQWYQHVAFEGYVATRALVLGPATTLIASADDRFSHDTIPHLQSIQNYAMILTQRVNRFVTISGSINDTPIHDGYPTLNAVYASHFTAESVTFQYNHGSVFSLFLTGSHGTGSTQLPGGVLVTPWVTSADVRFRVNRALSVELGRSYFFGFEGQRYGTITFQLFP